MFLVDMNKFCSLFVNYPMKRNYKKIPIHVHIREIKNNQSFHNKICLFNMYGIIGDYI
jgi:hypothetical protein